MALKLEMTNYDLFSPKRSLPKDSVNCDSSVTDDLEMSLDNFRHFFICELKSSIKTKIKQGKQNYILEFTIT